MRRSTGPNRGYEPRYRDRHNKWRPARGRSAPSRASAAARRRPDEIVVIFHRADPIALGVDQIDEVADPLDPIFAHVDAAAIGLDRRDDRRQRVDSERTFEA